MTVQNSDKSENETYRRPDGRPKKTGARLYEATARVLVHDTTAHNETTRITIEHTEHDGGVCSWLRYSHDAVGPSVRKHLHDALEADIVRLDVVDEAGVGMSEATLLETETATVAEVSA